MRSSSDGYAPLEDCDTKATGDSSQNENSETQDTENSLCSSAEAINCDAKAIGECSHAEGCKTRAIGSYSHAEGSFSIAVNTCSHAEGDSTIAGTDTSGKGAHAEGCNTEALADCSHAEGSETIASGEAAHAEGDLTKAIGRASHAEGISSIAGTETGGLGAHAEGCNTQALGDYSHAEGSATIASGQAAHAEGFDTTASGINAHAEGENTTASGYDAHAEGFETTANTLAAHAEGRSTKASGVAAHAEGYETVASRNYAHAEGGGTIANGDFSHAEGNYTNTNGHTGAHIMGQFGDAGADYSWFLANGTSLDNKSIAAKILNNGNACFAGSLTAGGGPGSCADYAEMFESLDGKPIDCGYFVTLKGEKIRKAKANDSYILGITSATPAVIGNSGELNWKNRYMTDKWGRVQYHDVLVPAVTDKNGKVIIPEDTETQPVLNPDWDNTKEYIPRRKRCEWVAVGLIGQILVRDDGTCKEDGYCKPNDEGFATASSEGYRVMKRTGENQVLVLFR
ncbi:MAG: peptidase G2 autoproteolytic cleavage domain-containing protein [Desulfotomaculaceae bacterium]|nr:peptidase G2 autoproteolytic cleavage domain-containing protein [Desulfotomaculaceae bacterium]